MNKGKNFFRRTLDAIVEGRAREAQRFVDRYERDHGLRDKMNGR
ncbi:hypothetical protein [Devosia rhizoryzae]|nr:hypothetical protein [Devosia rhizoryzae]